MGFSVSFLLLSFFEASVTTRVQDRWRMNTHLTFFLLFFSFSFFWGGGGTNYLRGGACN